MNQALRYAGKCGARFGAFGILGYSAGYAVKKVGKTLLVFVGGSVILITVLEYNKWIVVNWQRAANEMNSFGQRAWDKAKRFTSYLAAHLPDYTGFVSGFFLALL